MRREINASVHDIVDFVYATGDIIPATMQKNNLRDGTLIHVEIQKQYTCDKEFYVKIEETLKDYQVFLQGRIDLLDKINDQYHIIEVKSTYTLDNLTEDTYLAHFAQAKFYGYMLYHHINIPKDDLITISVMYVHKYTYEKKFFTKDYTYNEIKQFFENTMGQYIEYIDIIDTWNETKLDSLNELTFPFSKYRNGQNELIQEVYDSIKHHNNLFVCAPTGIGKSLGTIYPSLKSLHQKEEKIFYLTSKSMIKDVARSAVELMRKQSHLQLKTLTITAKEKICINEVLKCHPKECIYAKDFYGRVNEAVIDMFQNEDDWHYETILQYARKHQVCPFEFQLSLSLCADLIICDYNYVFDIRVYLRRFFDNDTQHLVLLIDEAHNLYDRVCNMFTSSINYKIIHDILDLIDNDKEVNKYCQMIDLKLRQYQNQLRRSNKKNLKYEDLDQALLNDVASLLTKMEKYFDKARENDLEISEELIDNYFSLSTFIKISEYFSQDFFVWVSDTSDDLNYQITCLNPRELIQMRTEQVKSSVLFSATLHPMDYYMSVLGGGDKSKSLVLESPFIKENLELIVNNSISTKYNNREMTKYQIAYEIENFISEGGKYLIYFSSYQYLELVYKTFNKINQYDVEIIKQEKDMMESQRNQFLKKYDESKKNIVGFAVLGGVFSEGIDLKGDKLNGVIVVGVGLPTFDDFRNELKQYFDDMYHRGYQFAYMYPGFNKVLQAVGRVIRSEEDRGKVLLIDERYLSYDYLKLFPKHWSHYRKL